MAPSAPPAAPPPGDWDLVVITDESACRPHRLRDMVAAALEAGAPAIQLRHKAAPAAKLLETALVLRALTRAHGAALIVNDRLDVALAAGADGVHLGADDPPVAAARRRVPPSFWIGASSDDPLVAQRLVRDGADYIGCGTVWPSPSKVDSGSSIGVAGVAAVARSVSVPVIAIGGITIERAAELVGSGASGIAVIHAVMGAPGPAPAGEAVRRLRRSFRPA